MKETENQFGGEFAIFTVSKAENREFQVPKKGHSGPSDALEKPEMVEQHSVLRKPRL